METRLDVTKTGIPLADRLTESLLNARQTLPHGVNGKAPRCSSPRAAYLLNEIGASRMKPFHAIDDVFDCCIQDGVPLAELTAILDQWRAALEARAVARFLERRERASLPELFREASLKETQAECKANPVQARADIDPTNLATLEAFAREGTRHYESLGIAISVTRQAIEVVRCGDRRIYGAKRAPMEVMR